LIIYAMGLDKIERPSDTVIFKGIDFLLDTHNRNAELATFLSNFNIFSIWYILVISTGIRTFTGLKKIESFMLSGISWICWSVVSILEPLMTESVMNFMS
jgi:hypothetical protein